MYKHVGLKALLAAVLLCCSVSLAEAHKPLMAVEDNNDGTIYLEAGFSDGSSAAGHKIVLKEEKTGKVISEHKVGEDGTLEVDKPKVPYTVTLDAGEGHVVTVDGPPPAASEKSSAEAPPQGAGTAEDKTGAAAPATSTPAAQIKDSAKPAAPPKAAKQPQAAPAAGPVVSVPAVTATMSPGAMMAFKMMITTQIVTATALIILLAVVVYVVGYRAGKNAAGASRRKEQ